MIQIAGGILVAVAILFGVGAIVLLLIFVRGFDKAVDWEATSADSQRSNTKAD